MKSSELGPHPARLDVLMRDQDKTHTKEQPCEDREGGCPHAEERGLRRN